MNTKLYVGGLASGITPADLRISFEKYGVVTDLHLPTDRSTGRFRGFAFITFNTEDECREAIAKMNGTELGGRVISVKEARAPGETAADSVRPKSRNDDAAEFYARASRRGK
ncbi:MAG: RNA-binding protein [Nibricoccus sp.]